MSPILFLSIALQIACVVHVVRTHRPTFWIWILLIGSYIAVAAYIFAEVVPNLGSSPTARRTMKGVAQRIDPEKGKRHAARQLDIADTIDNRRRLAEQSLASGDYQQAMEMFRNALTGMYATDPHLMLGLAQAQFALDLPAEARATLDALIAANPKFRSFDGHLLYARTVEASGDIDKALTEYEALVQGFPGEEARVRYAQLLKRANRPSEAANVLREIAKRSSLAPKYYQREQRKWIDLAKRELSDLS